MFNIIPGMNKSKTLTKYISCEWKCKFDQRKCNSNQWWDNDKCRCECKKHNICKKDNVWNPATCSCENGKYLTNIMDDSVITYEKIIEWYDDETKTIPTNFNKKMQPVKQKISIFSLPFY